MAETKCACVCVWEWNRIGVTPFANYSLSFSCVQKRSVLSSWQQTLHDSRSLTSKFNFLPNNFQEDTLSSNAEQEKPQHECMNELFFAALRFHRCEGESNHLSGCVSNSSWGTRTRWQRAACWSRFPEARSCSQSTRRCQEAQQPMPALDFCWTSLSTVTSDLHQTAHTSLFPSTPPLSGLQGASIPPSTPISFQSHPLPAQALTPSSETVSSLPRHVYDRRKGVSRASDGFRKGGPAVGTGRGCSRTLDLIQMWIWEHPGPDIRTAGGQMRC